MIDAPKYKLGSICEVVSGGTPRRSERSFWDGGTIPWVKISDITGKRVGATEEFITDEGLAHSSAKLIQPGAVLYSIFASIGATGILTIPAATNQAIAAVRPKDGSLSIDYLYHWLKAQENVARASSRGVAQNNINLSILRAMEMPLPDYGVQEGVAASFDAVLARRDSYSEQLVKLDELVKSRFVEMFGGISWPIAESGDLFYGIRNGVSPSKSASHRVRVLTLSAITQGFFDISAYKVDSFKAEPPVDKRVVAFDFYMCRGNGNKALVGRGEYALEDRYDLVFPDTVIATHVDRSRVDLPYLREAWRQPYVRQQIESMAKTTNGTYKVNQSMIKSVRLQVPPLELQKEFAAFVAQVDKLKFETQQAIDKLQLLYDSLAQEYFAVE